MRFSSWLRNSTPTHIPRDRAPRRPAAARFLLRLEALEDRCLPSASLDVPQWTSQGPGPITGEGNTAAFPNSQVTGAVESIAVAPVPITNQNPGGPGSFMLSAMSMFNRLGLTDKDGWVPPKGGNYVEAAQKWVKDNAGTYRIKKFVAE